MHERGSRPRHAHPIPGQVAGEQGAERLDLGVDPGLVLGHRTIGVGDDESLLPALLGRAGPCDQRLQGIIRTIAGVLDSLGQDLHLRGDEAEVLGQTQAQVIDQLHVLPVADGVEQDDLVIALIDDVGVAAADDLESERDAGLGDETGQLIGPIAQVRPQQGLGVLGIGGDAGLGQDAQAPIDHRDDAEIAVPLAAHGQGPPDAGAHDLLEPGRPRCLTEVEELVVAAGDDLGVVRAQEQAAGLATGLIPQALGEGPPGEVAGENAGHSGHLAHADLGVGAHARHQAGRVGGGAGKNRVILLEGVQGARAVGVDLQDGEVPAVLHPVLECVDVGGGQCGPRLLGAGAVAVSVNLEDPRVGQAELDGALVAGAALEGGGPLRGAEQELEHGDLGEVPGQQAVFALGDDPVDGDRVQARVGDQDVLAGEAQADHGDHAGQKRLDIAVAPPRCQDLTTGLARVRPAAAAHVGAEHAQVLVVVALDEDDVVREPAIGVGLIEDEVEDARGVGTAVEQVADEDEQGRGVPAAEVLLGLGQCPGAALHVADDDQALVALGDVDLRDRVEAAHVVQAHHRLDDGGGAGPHPGRDARHDLRPDVVDPSAAGLVALDQLGIAQLSLNVDDVDRVSAAPRQRGEFAIALAGRVGAVQQEGAALPDPGGDGGLEGRDDLLLGTEGHGQGGPAVQIRERGGVQAPEVVQADGEVAEPVAADQSRFARTGRPAQDE